jgi:hypothetical protein
MLCFGFLKVLNLLRTFESFGKLVMLIINTVKDTRIFMEFLILWILFYGFVFIALRIEYDSEDYNSLSMFLIMFIQTYRNILGDLNAPDTSQWLDEDG